MNLFNHVLVLFCIKFACNLAIIYLVLRWESCKSCVWKSVKNSSVWAFKEVLMTGSHEWLAIGDSPKRHMCEACRKLKGHNSWSTTGQKRTIWPVSYFATQSHDSSQSRVSRQNTLFCRKMTFHIPHVSYYKYSYTHEM